MSSLAEIAAAEEPAAEPQCISEADSCYNPGHAQSLRIAAIFIILFSSSLGVLIPLLGKRFRFLNKERSTFLALKAFGAGVILATGFVHIFPDAEEALANECLGWPDFPWAGMIATVTALATQLLEFCINQGLQSQTKKRLAAKQGMHACGHACTSAPGPDALSRQEPASTSNMSNMSSPSKPALMNNPLHSRFDKDHTAVEMGTATPQRERLKDESDEGECAECDAAVGQEVLTMADLHAHTHDEENHLDACAAAPEKARHVAIAQVLELGIAVHSVLIGIALGVSESPCSIRPLLAALTFHQFFEGIALGACLMAADFQVWTYALMAVVFALTTPVGIAIGLGITHLYNENSPTALGTQGVFDAVSAGILIYMALVDLIAVDFTSNKIKSSIKIQAAAYGALFAGAALMCALAIWA